MTLAVGGRLNTNATTFRWMTCGFMRLAKIQLELKLQKCIRMLNKSEDTTLQLSIFYEKVLDKKYLPKLNNVAQTSSKRFVETPLISRLMYELCSFKCLKLYSLKFAIAHAQIKIVMLFKIGLNCVA